MSDEFTLKWDGDSEQLVGEDPNGNRIAVPIEAVQIDTSATIDGEQVAIDGDEQPPETHGNEAHSSTFAEDGDTQPPETHGNEAHSSTFAEDGDTQPPETHGNEAHSSNYTTTSPSDVDSSNWSDYEIQKNGSDGSGVINFKT